MILIEEAYEQIQQIENTLASVQGVYELESLVDQLNRLDTESIRWSITSEEMNRLYTMKSALNLVRQQTELRIKALRSMC